MGLFDKIFTKKVCDICGGEIGLLGNRKLEDGNLCKDCARKLSPWMTDRRESTVEEIRKHLAYREDNKRAVAAFRPSRTLGNGTKIYIDEAARKFLVTASADWKNQNPDVIALSQITDCRVDVEEHRKELYTKDKEGKQVSYNPRRYEFSYEFTVRIDVNSPYFNEISFELTKERPENRLSREYRDYENQAAEIQTALTGRTTFAARTSPFSAAQAVNVAAAAANGAARPADDSWKCPQCGAAATGNFCPECGAKKPLQTGWRCPQCGRVNEGRFCSACGAKKPQSALTYRCDKCGWRPDDPAHPPKFCPQCGDLFDERDAQ